MIPTLSACEAAAAIRSGTLTSVDLVQQCIARIEELEDTVRAWTFFDPAYALHQAREADRLRSRTHRSARFMAYRWGSRIFSIQATCQPRTARFSTPDERRSKMPPQSHYCAPLAP